MTTILFYTFILAFCKHASQLKSRRGYSRVCQTTLGTGAAQQPNMCLQTARTYGKKVLKSDFYGVRGCCRTCLREKAEPDMRGFRKWRDRLRWVCLCFECRCRRCTRRVYGKCVV